MPDISIFSPEPSADQVMALANHLPVGRIWDRCIDQNSNIYKLLAGLSLEFFRLELLDKIFSDEIDILQTVSLIAEWEKSVGLPDACFSTKNELIEIRRQQVLQKFSNLGGVQSAEDFERVAAIFGYDIDIVPGSAGSTFPLVLPYTLFSESGGKHTIVIKISEEELSGDYFPLTLPYTLGSLQPPFFLKCIFEKLAPANVDVKFVGVQPPPPPVDYLGTEGGDLITTEAGDLILIE